MTDETNTNSNDAPESGERSTPANKTPPTAPARTSLEQFSEVLHALDPDGGDDDAAEGEETHDDDGDEPAVRKPKKPKTLDDVAEQLGVKAASLYDIEIPSSRAGEKPFTLGQLKDLMKERDDFAVASLKLDEDRRTHEREKVAAEEELKEMLSVVPAAQLEPKAVEKVRGIIKQKRARERAEVLEAIPGWKDPVTRESELKAITEHLAGYGIRDAFILANLNAPVMKMLRDTWRLTEKVNKALSVIEERRTKTPGRSRKSDKPGAKRDDRSAPVGRVQGEVAGFRAAIQSAAQRKH